jgi:zinc-ribbon domain
MPNCAFCGAELPNNARFCSNCGQVPKAIAEQTPNMRVSPMQSIPTPLRQQTSLTEEEQQRPTLSDNVLPGIPLGGQRPSGNMPQAASTLSTMASSQTPPSVGNQPPPTNGTQTPLDMQPPVSFPRVSRSQPQSQRPNWMGNVPLRWAIIGLAIIIVVASGLGILTAVARVHSRANNASTPSNQTNPACPNQHSATCKPQKNGKTPVVSASAVNLLFSGAVTGRLTSTHITSCGASGSNYDVNVQGKVGSTQYDLVFRITAYKGAGTYNTGQIFSNLTQQPVSFNTTWINTGNSPATATINSNIKSGTMAITDAGAFNSVRITGNWTCA